MPVHRLLLTLTLLLCAAPAAAQATKTPEPLGIALEGYAYPAPVQFLPLTLQGQDVRMAYMDVPPSGKSNGRTVLLLHGKNFFGAYWRDTLRALSEAGYRVVVPDQVGFGKSSKPAIDYSFHTLAHNTKQLLDTLGIQMVVVVGHSMGGMVATRFARLSPTPLRTSCWRTPSASRTTASSCPGAPPKTSTATSSAPPRRACASTRRRTTCFL